MKKWRLPLPYGSWRWPLEPPNRLAPSHTPWCAGCGRLAAPVQAKRAKRPDFITFLAALDGMALAAHAVGVRRAHVVPVHGWHCALRLFPLQVWDYGAARAHARILLEIGATAAFEGRRHHLMQYYDEVARREWNEKATRGDQAGTASLSQPGARHALRVLAWPGLRCEQCLHEDRP